MSNRNKLDKSNRIAIIGIAGKFPGANSITQFWNNLYNAKDAIALSTRWGSSKYYGGFLEDIEYFDADFFNISPKEAKFMDPQQKHLLEISWQTFCDAGYSKQWLQKKKVGVFTTSLPGDYKYRLKDAHSLDYFSFLGNASSVNAGRISYFYDFNGPAIHLDTACSSSLVCIDTAINNIRNGSCDMAFVGASTIFSTPEIFKLAESAKISSKKGKCFTFDERADGFVPAETVSGILICTEEFALQNNKHIYATIEHSLVNHNGLTNGIMSPSIAKQKELLIDFYRTCKVDTAEIGYLEVHGTGTQIGDLMEVNALKEAFSSLNNAYELNIGSCKTNIGHTLVSSGLVSLIKGLLVFEKGFIPKHINFDSLNKKINLDNLNIVLENTAWNQNKNYLAISAFGFSGTNAHLLIKKSNNVRRIKNNFYHFDRKRYWVDIDISTDPPPSKESIYFKQKETVGHSATLKTEENIYESNEKCILNNNTAQESFYTKYIKREICKLLSYNFQDIDKNKKFEDLGMDSLVTMELVKSLKQYDKDITILKIFKYNTINLLSKYLATKGAKSNATKVLHTIDDASLDHINKLTNSDISANTTITQNSDIPLEWIILGKGKEPLLLLPPLNSSFKIWTQQIRFFLQRNYKIYIPSYPGHGKSPFDFYSIFKIAQIVLSDLKKIIENKQFAIMGWSIGGCLGALIAYLCKKRVSKLILINSAPQFDASIFANSNLLRAELMDNEYFIRNLFGNRQDAVKLISASCPLDQLGHYYQELENFNILELLSQIVSETLILYGKKDPVLNLQHSKSFSLIPKSKMIKLDSGHFIPLTKAYLFNNLALTFLKS